MSKHLNVLHEPKALDPLTDQWIRMAIATNIITPPAHERRRGAWADVIFVVLALGAVLVLVGLGFRK
jgi:hypothetical protein